MARKKKVRRIGIVDNTLENYHANVYLQHVRGDLKKRGFEVAGAWALQEKPSRAWCEANNVPWCASPEELNERVDHYMILAPSNPELHLGLCQTVFPFGKTTYVDKTFADSLAAARKIFRLADKHKVAVQTSSALRYTNVQEAVTKAGQPVQHIVTWGAGRSFAEYAIHPLEMAISIMGSKATALQRRGKGECSQLLIDFTGGRTAVVNVYLQGTPFAAAVNTAEATSLLPVENCDIFLNMASAILDLFERGKPDIDRHESLMIRKILDKASDPRALKSKVKL